MRGHAQAQGLANTLRLARSGLGCGTISNCCSRRWGAPGFDALSTIVAAHPAWPRSMKPHNACICARIAPVLQRDCTAHVVVFLLVVVVVVIDPTPTRQAHNPHHIRIGGGVRERAQPQAPPRPSVAVKGPQRRQLEKEGTSTSRGPSSSPFPCSSHQEPAVSQPWSIGEQRRSWPSAPCRRLPQVRGTFSQIVEPEPPAVF